MRKPTHHILVCSSSRMIGEPKGGCFKKNAPDLVQYIQTEIDDRGLENIMVTNTGCLKLCDEGPVVIIYPEGYWYGNVDEGAADTILDALEDGKPAEDLLIA